MSEINSACSVIFNTIPKDAQVHAQVVLLFALGTRTLRADLWSIRGTFSYKTTTVGSTRAPLGKLGRTRQIICKGFRQIVGQSDVFLGFLAFNRGRSTK